MPSSPSSLVVSSETPDGSAELARFEIGPDGRVTATYANEVFKAQIEDEGIWTPHTGTLKVSDGSAFMRALPVAFASSSTIRVDPDAPPPKDRGVVA